MIKKIKALQPRGIQLNSSRTAIFLKIFIVVIGVAFFVNTAGLIVGAVFLTRSIGESIEDNMLISVDIADKFVTNEIEWLKAKTGEAARDIKDLYELGEREGVLAQVIAGYSKYIGLAVFDRTGLLDYYGQLSIHPDLFRERFMQIAMAGGQAISTTMFTPDGSLVMYVSAPINGELVLAAAVPGLYISNLLSQFTFWQSGHLFIDDEEGTTISNARPHWVLERINFIELARTNRSYEDISAMVKRRISGERGTARFTVEGLPRICAFRPISSPTENWFVGIVAPVSESALKDIPTSILLMGLITLALSVVAAIAAAIFLRRPYEDVDKLRKAAEIASLSKSAFLANMSHEIRTPMNSIIGFSELVMDAEIPPKAKEYLGKLQTNAEWLLHIINDILDISKVEAGRMELENIPFDMHELFNSCRVLVMPKAFEKGILLHFYAEPSIGKRPLGDPTRLRQVLVNLLSNAVKFTNTGMVKLHAAVQDMGEKTITMHFEVKDSGIGMTQEQIKKIFDPFTQAESDTTRKYGGTGLGLPISKRIVELMGGKLSVESTPGIGSKFSFDIMFDMVDVQDNDTVKPKAALTEIEKPIFEGEILLVEDNPMNQEVICEHLARVGLTTTVAGNGKLGVEMVQRRMQEGKKQFDLIFMDVHMPVMDGLEASAKILEMGASVPIIAMTANIMSNETENYRMSGMHDCVGKPFTSQELWHCLMKYLTPLRQESVKKLQQVEAEMEFQKELQIMFLKTSKNRFDDITKALKENDIKLAHRLVHTLKGNAGQIGKNILQQAATNVEHQLKDGKNLVTKEQLASLKTELDIALAHIAAEYPELPGESSKSAAKTCPNQEWLTEESVMEMFKQLEPLLKMGSPDCLKFTDALRLIPPTLLENSTSTNSVSTIVEELIRQMGDFDFDSAIDTLAELKNNCGMS